VFAIGGLGSHIPHFTAEYVVQRDGSIHLAGRGLVTPADLSKEYTVGDVIEADGQPSGGGIGIVDGSNTTFTLSYYPLGPAAVNLFLNGLYQAPGADYTLNGKVITLNAPPQAGDRVRVAYRGEFSQ
jgi:hypothetical protein